MFCSTVFLFVLVVILPVKVTQGQFRDGLYFEWACGSGEYVEFYEQCEGVPACTDGSDESPATCPSGSDYVAGEYLVVSSPVVSKFHLFQLEVATGRVRRINDTELRQYAHAVAIDVQTQNLYYGSYINGDGQDVINVFNWATKTKSILSLGYHKAASALIVTINSIGGLLYISTSANKINELKISDGTYRDIQTGIDPYAVVYDEGNNNLYWTDIGFTAPGIYMCSIGAVIGPAIPLVTTGITRTYCLAIDFSIGVMYWIDSDARAIESANLDGTNRNVLLVLLPLIVLPGPTYKSIVVTPNHLYYVVENYGRIQNTVAGIERRGLGRHRYANLRFDQWQDFTVSSYVLSSNTCMLDYKHCAGDGCVYIYDICDGVKDCADGSDEQAPLCTTGTKQYEPDNFLLVMDKYHRTFYQVKPVTGEVIHLIGATMHIPNMMAVDPDSCVVYFVDEGDLTVKQFSLDTKTQKVVYQDPGDDYMEELHYMGVIALDTQRGFLYTSIRYLKIVEVSLNDSSVNRTVIEASRLHIYSFCCGMAFNMDTRTLYWVDRWAILSLSMEPNSAVITVVGGLTETFTETLAIDFEAKQIFWTDVFSHTVETCSLDGTNRQTIATNELLVDDARLTFDGTYLYIANSASSRISRLDRTNNYTEYVYPDQAFAHITGLAYVKQNMFNCTPTLTSETTTQTTTTAEAPTTVAITTTTEKTTATWKSITVKETFPEVTEQITTMSNSSKKMTSQSVGSTAQSEESSTQSGGSTTQTADSPEHKLTKPGFPNLSTPAGGGIMTFVGQYLDNPPPIRAHFTPKNTTDSKIKPLYVMIDQDACNEGVIAVTIPRAPNDDYVGQTFEVVIEFAGSKNLTTTPMSTLTYTSKPNVTKIHPRSQLVTGGTLVTFIGQNFLGVQSPILHLFAVIFDTTQWPQHRECNHETPCYVHNDSNIICQLPVYDISLEFRKSLLNGTNDTAEILPPTENTNEKYICQQSIQRSRSNESWISHSRRKRDAIGVINSNSSSGQFSLAVTLGVTLDDYDHFKDFKKARPESEIDYYNRIPTFNDLHITEYHPESDGYLHVEGEKLRLGLNSDGDVSYVATVGSGLCDIDLDTITDNKMVVRPPRIEPSAADGNSTLIRCPNKKSLEFVIQYGLALRYSLGCLSYASIRYTEPVIATGVILGCFLIASLIITIVSLIVVRPKKRSNKTIASSKRAPRKPDTFSTVLGRHSQPPNKRHSADSAMSHSSPDYARALPNEEGTIASKSSKASTKYARRVKDLDDDTNSATKSKPSSTLRSTDAKTEASFKAVFRCQKNRISLNSDISAEDDAKKKQTRRSTKEDDDQILPKSIKELKNPGKNTSDYSRDISAINDCGEVTGSTCV